ncbi:hypothetical protein [Streptomyces sp. SID3915]|uniref:hypothetical protein n=1 Tax=Streptomyces sp. SID3915 TaxID=2690263 RepID=UPI00136B53B3|nr:hypothetical protein [Streptomyces sp. SID3915]MYX74732.1 hypothetical protein [Streptomyces sp. SID3915]
MDVSPIREGAHNAADAAQGDADSANSIAQYAEEAAVRAEAAAANAQASAVEADEAATRTEEALRQRIEAARAERAEGAGDTGAELSGEEESILLRLCGQSCVDEWRVAKNATAQDVLDWIKANGGEIILDVVGYTDAKTCFTKGDIEACLWTLINAASVAVVVLKLPALSVAVARVTAGITKFFEASAKGKRTLKKLRDLIEKARKDPNTPPCVGKSFARAAADDVCNLDWEIGDLPYETLDDLDTRYGSDITDGVEYNWRKMQEKGADGKPTKNAIDHAIPGIGTNVEELAKYWAKWRGKATHIDPTTKNTVAFDEAKGVLVIIKDRYIHGYRMTKAKFLEKFDPLPSS